MRIRFSCCLTILIVLFGLASARAQVPQIINYQGRVVVDKTNFTGTGKFKFALVITTGIVTQWSNDGTSSSGSEPTSAVSLQVVNGLYSVLLGDTSIPNMTQPIPISAFTFSSDIRLRVWFNDGVHGFQLLSPDQRIAATPWAMVAAKVTGDVAAGQITGLLPASQLGGGTITGTVTFANASSPSAAPFVVSNSNKVSSLNSDLLDGFDSTAFVKRAGDTMTGNLAMGTFGVSFGAETRQMIDLYNTSYGIGIQNSTLYERSSGGNFAWFRGGVHSDNAFDPGGGLLTMRLDGNGELHVAGPVAGFSLQNRQSASYVATPTAGERWDAFVSGGVYHLWSGNDKLTIDTNGKVTAASALFSVTGTAVTATGTARGLEATATGAGIAVRAIDGTGGGAQTSSGVYAESTQSDGNGVVAVANNGTDAYAIWGKSTSGYAGVFDGKLKVNGTAFVGALTITGGADLAEPFKISSKNKQRGSVLVIDEEQPGHLTESTHPYDKRVAGVISGANGVRPGIKLQQDGVMEGDEYVALSGRVYVRADTGNGKIKPGDLLTTSSRPGCAMRVTEHERAQGAIIGKAMSELSDPEGYVLVLVTLQ